MKKLLTFSALTFIAVAGLATQANAWERHRTVTGANGAVQLDASGNCAGGSCTRSVTRTGPYGATATRQGSVSCNGETQSCTGTRVTTGPNGGTVTRQGSISR